MKFGKPFYKSARQCWYVNVTTGSKTKQEKLDRDETEAKAKLESMKAEATGNAPGTLGALIDDYLAWLPANKSAGTVRSYTHYLSAWKETHGTLGVGVIRGHHVEELVTKKFSKKEGGGEYSDSVRWQTKKSCVVFFGWLLSQGHVTANPLSGYRKNVACGVRQSYLKQEDYDRLIACCSDPGFRDLLAAMWHTGARPAELFQSCGKHYSRERRTLNFRKSDGDYVKSRRKDAVRVIYLSPEANEIVARLADQHGDGLLFRNSAGQAWSISVCTNRLDTLERRCGVRTTMYEFRHGYCFRKAPTTDIHTLAKLAGTSVKMIESVYSHLGDNHDHLLGAA